MFFIKNDQFIYLNYLSHYSFFLWTTPSNVLKNDAYLYWINMNFLQGKTPEEIRKTFNIKNDFTPSEEEQVFYQKLITYKQFSWFVIIL